MDFDESYYFVDSIDGYVANHVQEFWFKDENSYFTEPTHSPFAPNMAVQKEVLQCLFLCNLQVLRN